MQCNGCKRSISVFWRVCPYCSYDQRRRVLALEATGTENGAKESESHDVFTPEETPMAADSDEIDRWGAALKGCLFYTHEQCVLLEAEYKGSWPTRARDQFSLGFLSGYVDGWMQAFSVENESLRATALAKVFEEVFTSDQDSCLMDAFSQMRSGTAPFLNAMTIGGNDAIESIRDHMSGASSALPKLTWAQYVMTGLHPSV